MRHHSSICMTYHTSADATATSSDISTRNLPPPTSASQDVYVPTTTALIGSHMPILLQTAKVTVCGTSSGSTLEVRAILDSGSQRSYTTIRVRERLQLRMVQSENMSIKSFGSTTEDQQVRDVVKMKILMKNSDPLILAAVVVPHICDAIPVPSITATGAYEHRSGLELADSGDVLEIDILVGSDHYWEVVTGRIIRGASGPAAVETRLEWVLSGPVEGVTQESIAINFISTHTLRVDAFTEQQSLEEGLRRFWELESLGILKDEQSVYGTFTRQISFKQGRYEVHLPWKESHPLLPDNYELCRKRSNGLLRRLNQNPE